MNAFLLREPFNAWSHALGLMLALTGVPWLVRRGGDRAMRAALLAYGLSLVGCYAASTLYHGLRLPADRLAVFDRLDRVGIFGLIAGSYTPIAWGLLRGPWRWGTLAATWGVAAAASAQITLGGPPRPWVSTGLYLGLGWGALGCYPRVVRAVPRRELLPLLVGGICYSLGAVLNVLRWPPLWPRSFGPHGLFHLFVMAGSLAHFQFVARSVARPRRPDAAGH